MTCCPHQFVGPVIATELQVVRLMRRGVLPEPGGLLDQPMRYVEMERIDNAESSQAEATRARS